MSARPSQLERELWKLEQIDPAVRAAARSYEHAIRDVLAKRREKATDPKAFVPCCAATLDAHGRYCIGYCGPSCLRRPCGVTFTEDAG